MLVLHLFMVAISRETLFQEDGDGSTIDPLVWENGFRTKVRKTGSRIIEDFAGLPGRPGFLDLPVFLHTLVQLLIVISVAGLCLFPF